MKQVLQNPFRVLGLPVTATDRQIAKRVMEAETYLEMGKTLKVESEFAWMPPVTRSIESIKDAQGRLHRLEDRSFHAMFWFHAQDPVDELSLEVLKDGHYEKAISLLSKRPSLSNLINLYVLHFALSGINDTDSQEQLFRGLQVAGEVFSSTVALEAFVRKAQWDRFEHGRVIQEMHHEAIRKVAGKNSLLSLPVQEIRRFLSSIAPFPQERRNWVEDRFVDECRTAVESAVALCHKDRGHSPEDAIDHGNRLVRETRAKLGKLAGIISASDTRLTMLYDQVAEEALQCSIDYHNYVMDQDTDDELSLQPSVDLAKTAGDLAHGSVIKRRIQENLVIAIEHAENQTQQKRTSRPIKEFFAALEALPKPDRLRQDMYWGLALTVERFLVRVKPPLVELRGELGPQDEAYLKLSSLAVHVSLALLIEFANATRDWNKTLTLMRTLGQFDMDASARARYRPNLATIEGNVGGKPLSSCFIATCVYGGHSMPEVIALRRFRDQQLGASALGRLLIRTYYACSPILARRISLHPWCHKPIRWLLNRIARPWLEPAFFDRRTCT